VIGDNNDYDVGIGDDYKMMMMMMTTTTMLFTQGHSNLYEGLFICIDLTA
jgi:hypothetical protein